MSSPESVLAVQGAPEMIKPVLSVDQRIEICKEIPREDWERFAGLRHVAVSIHRRCIVDGDNDLFVLQERVAEQAQPDEEFFIAPGKSVA